MGFSPEHQQREKRLDALRGIAALSVAVAHCVTAFANGPFYNQTFLDLNYSSRSALFFRFLYIVFNADAAVIIFFVLSGYVLTKSLRRIHGDPITQFMVYMVKRFYRIFPAVVVSFLPVAYFVDKPAWEYIRNMLLLKATINGVTWTLQVEVVASILIFLVFMIKTKAPFLGVPFFVFLSLLFVTGYRPAFFLYFPAFFLGCYLEEIRNLLLGKEKILILPTVVCLLGAEFFLGYKTSVATAMMTAASVILVGCVPTSTFFNFLDHKLLGFLGRISFSFYLLHFTGALIVSRLGGPFSIYLRHVHPVYGAILYMLTTIPLAIGIATLSFYLVEKPSIAAGVEVSRAVEESVSPLFRTKDDAIRETAQPSE